MGRDGPRYPSDEIARRAEEIYAKIKHVVDEGNHGKILAIDIESGEYEIDDSDIAAVDRLYVRLPDPEIFCLRIGYRAVLRIRGPWFKRAS